MAVWDWDKKLASHRQDLRVHRAKSIVDTSPHSGSKYPTFKPPKAETMLLNMAPEHPPGTRGLSSSRVLNNDTYSSEAVIENGPSKETNTEEPLGELDAELVSGLSNDVDGVSKRFNQVTAQREVSALYLRVDSTQHSIQDRSDSGTRQDKTEDQGSGQEKVCPLYSKAGPVHDAMENGSQANHSDYKEIQESQDPKGAMADGYDPSVLVHTFGINVRDNHET